MMYFKIGDIVYVDTKLVSPFCYKYYDTPHEKVGRVLSFIDDIYRVDFSGEIYRIKRSLLFNRGLERSRKLDIILSNEYI